LSSHSFQTTGVLAPGAEIWGYEDEGSQGEVVYQYMNVLKFKDVGKDEWTLCDRWTTFSTPVGNQFLLNFEELTPPTGSASDKLSNTLRDAISKLIESNLTALLVRYRAFAESIHNHPNLPQILNRTELVDDLVDELKKCNLFNIVRGDQSVIADTTALCKEILGEGADSDNDIIQSRIERLAKALNEMPSNSNNATNNLVKSFETFVEKSENTNEGYQSLLNTAEKSLQDAPFFDTQSIDDSGATPGEMVESMSNDTEAAAPQQPPPRAPPARESESDKVL
jgi:hypothetical protein